MSKESALAQMVSMTTPSETTAPQTTNAPVDAVQGIVENTQAPPKDELQSSRIAMLAKKEANIRRQAEEFKAQREAWLKEKEEADRYRQKGREFDEMRAKDPIAAFAAWRRERPPGSLPGQ